MDNALRKFKRVIVLPGLYDQTPEGGELLSCLVQALKYFCRCKEVSGAHQRFLFVALSNPARLAYKVGPDALN